MKVVRVHNTAPEAHRDIVQSTFNGRTIVRSGIACFAPHSYAHDGEKHVHEHDEVFIVLDGEITVPIVDGPTDIARTGDWVFVAAGEEHHLTNHTHLPCTAMYLILKKTQER